MLKLMFFSVLCLILDGETYKVSSSSCLDYSNCRSCRCYGTAASCDYRRVRKLPNYPKCIETFKYTGFCRYGGSGDCGLRHLNKDDFEKYVNLQVLHITEMKLENLPIGMFNSFKNLTELDISGNRFTLTNSLNFGNWSTLKRLILRNNFISELNSESLVGLTELEELDLSNNRIKCIHNDTFKTLPNLKILRLNNNKLDRLNGATFDGADSLEELYLNDNQLEELPNNTLSDASKLQIVDFSGNPLRCSCSAYQTVQDMIGKNTFVEGRCDNGTILALLSKSDACGGGC